MPGHGYLDGCGDGYYTGFCKTKKMISGYRREVVAWLRAGEIMFIHRLLTVRQEQGIPRSNLHQIRRRSHRIRPQHIPQYMRAIHRPWFPQFGITFVRHFTGNGTVFPPWSRTSSIDTFPGRLPECSISQGSFAELVVFPSRFRGIRQLSGQDEGDCRVVVARCGDLHSGIVDRDGDKRC